ncbi:hypothetical protein ACFPPD_05935 [Cohnella suwonensis]|uniref:Aminotransferase class I/classII domain-containing protein n=1 Tax=Cohnella suwonensis TaxID=696072 RepID=A0ABW0LQT7_9BACL
MALENALERHVAPYAERVAPNAQAGGFYVWLRLFRPTSDARLAEAASRAGVAVYPGGVFGANDIYTRRNDEHRLRIPPKRLPSRQPAKVQVDWFKMGKWDQQPASNTVC